MSKIYTCGDIHGNYKGLIQAIERSPFNPSEDTLISLGDLVDGGYDSALVIDYLAKLPNKILIKGNHDVSFTEWMNYGVHPYSWIQGGKQTAESYIKWVKDETGENRVLLPDGKGAYMCNLVYIDIPEDHRSFLNSAVNYYIDENTKNCFVHGGFNRHLHIDEQDFDDIYYWDRDLWLQALSYGAITDPLAPLKFKMKDNFNKIFIGHTSTLNWGKTEPMFAANIVNVDTGAGHSGKVTIIDTESLEYWQSDLVKELYGDDFRR